MKMIDLGVTQFLSGMALGVDMWAAQMVVALRKRGHKVRLICVLPCETQADKWAEEYRECYFQLLENADEVLYTNTRYSSTCMYERNKYLALHTDYLLAVYDGVSKGGTAKTVRFAENRGIPVTVIHPNTLLVTSTREQKTTQKASVITFF